AIAIYVPPVRVDEVDVARAVWQAAEAHAKPVLCNFLGRSEDSPGFVELVSHGVPSYLFPESAARSLAAMYRHGQYRKRDEGTERTFTVDRDGAPGGGVGTPGRKGTARRGLADGAATPPAEGRPRRVPRPRVRGGRKGGHSRHDARPGLRSSARLRARRDLRRIPEGRLLRTAALDGSRRDSDDRVDPYLPVAPRGPRGAGPRRAGPPGGHLAAGGARLGPRFDSGNGPQPGHRPGTGPRLSRRRRPNRPHGPIPGPGGEGTAVLGRCGRT